MKKIGKKCLRRSKASKKGWDTRIRKQGSRQIALALAKRNPTVSTVMFFKDVVVGGAKVIHPRKYRLKRATIRKAIKPYV